MKAKKFLIICFLTISIPILTKSQNFTVSTDIVSSYVWRGVKYADASIQPTLTFSHQNFSIGSWGSAGIDGFMEMDLYAKYAFNFGLSLGVTDYYYPGSNVFDYSTETGSHGYEINLGYGIKGLSLSANYILNEAGAAGTVGGDKYFEIGYAFNKFSIFAGAGDGWHTADGSFQVVNVGLSVTKDIQITDSFKVPLKGSAILNPATEQYYLTVGITL
ncbi:MAG TPA: hypothetical protein PK903_04600 [Paludibacteraceae bacterium]|jgi:hypothetical protein|nr:hypothetical protein [Paludibacteraceae bacterium]MDS1032254.1 TorF family putative porin [Porphyromonadaceae sp. NP-X]HOH55372.1 hypothetical protein [Paludibacteraceae bacterium]